MNEARWSNSSSAAFERQVPPPQHPTGKICHDILTERRAYESASVRNRLPAFPHTLTPDETIGESEIVGSWARLDSPVACARHVFAVIDTRGGSDPMRWCPR